MSKYDLIKQKCTICSSDFCKGKTESGTRFLKRRFCSRVCYWQNMVGRRLNPFSEEHKKKIGNGNRGKIHSKEQNEKHSQRIKGSIPWNKGKTGIYTETTRLLIGTKTKEGMSNPLLRKKLSELAKERIGYWKGKHRPDMMGDKHFAWKSNATSVNDKIRKSLEYKNWRLAVFQRDNYTCQECGDRGVTLHADHIKPFAYFSELRLVIENGQTLCVPCHKRTPTYGTGARKLYEVKVKNV